jgi:hypothetical protein
LPRNKYLKKIYRIVHSNHNLLHLEASCCGSNTEICNVRSSAKVLGTQKDPATISQGLRGGLLYPKTLP